MINPFKNKGFRNLTIKGVIFLAIIILIQKGISLLLVGSTFFQEFLDIPSQFQIGKGVISLSITNALIFGVVVFIMLTYKKIFTIKNYKIKGNQIWFILLSVFFLILHYIFKAIINWNLQFFSQAPIFWGIIKIVIQLLFAAALFVGIFGVEFTKYLFKNLKKQILITVIVTIIFFILMILIQNLWTYFSGAISEILYRVFSIFFNNVTYQPYVTSFTMQEGGGPLLGINNFLAIIGKPCSGIDSFLLFTGLYTLIFILDYRRLKKKVAIPLYFVGIIGMFLTNVLRILLLFIVGAYWSPSFAVGMFHNNAGWILFIGYFFVFWWAASKYVYKSRNKK